MIESDKTKRTFFKKVAGAVGFFAAAGYLSNLMAGRTDSIREINNKNANDVNKQKKAWMQKQFVLMTDDEKKQRLDEILEIHNKNSS